MPITQEERQLLMNGRRLWRPKLRELPQQCASCPFREGNDKEWMEVLNRLAKANGEPEVTKLRAHQARAQILEETSKLGDFMCHGSVYDQEMDRRPPSEHRQCPGATQWHKEGR